jgi:hypothetical protein
MKSPASNQELPTGPEILELLQDHMLDWMGQQRLMQQLDQNTGAYERGRGRPGREHRRDPHGPYVGGVKPMRDATEPHEPASRLHVRGSEDFDQ